MATHANELERLRPLEAELAETKAQLENLQMQITKLEEDLAQARQHIEDGEAERKALERKHASIVRASPPASRAAELTHTHLACRAWLGIVGHPVEGHAASVGPRAQVQRQRTTYVGLISRVLEVLSRTHSNIKALVPCARSATVAVSRTRSDISTQPSPQASTPTSDAPSLTQESEMLVQRLAEAQTLSWNLEDQQRVLRLRIKNLEEELRVKTEVIQQYMLREFAGELKPLPGPVAATLALANQGSSVASATLAGGNGDQSPMKAVQAAAGASPSPFRSPKKGKVGRRERRFWAVCPHRLAAASFD